LPDVPKRLLQDRVFVGLSMGARRRRGGLPAEFQHFASVPCRRPAVPLEKDDDHGCFPALPHGFAWHQMGPGCATFARSALSGPRYLAVGRERQWVLRLL